MAMAYFSVIAGHHGLRPLGDLGYQPRALGTLAWATVMPNA